MTLQMPQGGTWTSRPIPIVQPGGTYGSPNPDAVSTLVGVGSVVQAGSSPIGYEVFKDGVDDTANWTISASQPDADNFPNTWVLSSPLPPSYLGNVIEIDGNASFSGTVYFGPLGEFQIGLINSTAISELGQAVRQLGTWPTAQTFSSAGSYTIPFAGQYAIECWGAGGNGGGGTTGLHGTSGSGGGYGKATANLPAGAVLQMTFVLGTAQCLYAPAGVSIGVIGNHGAATGSGSTGSVIGTGALSSSTATGGSSSPSGSGNSSSAGGAGGHGGAGGIAAALSDNGFNGQTPGGGGSGGGKAVSGTTTGGLGGSAQITITPLNAGQPIYGLFAVDGDGSFAGTAAVSAAGLATLDNQVSQGTDALASSAQATSILTAIGNVAANVWSYVTRTLSGSGGAVGPTAGANLASIPFGPVRPGQTLDLSACVSFNGQYATIETTTSVGYTIYQVIDGIAEPVPGQANVSVGPSACLFDTLQTDGEAANYNFRFRPNQSLGQPFPCAGRYLVAVSFAATSGQTYYANFRGEARW